MVLIIDNYDSFTYNLFQYFQILDQKVEVIRNDLLDVDGVKAMNPEIIVISPGPGGPEATGNCFKIIEFFKGEIPIFGICLGMQTIAAYFGSKIVKASEPVHGKIRLAHHDETRLFEGLPNPLNVTRYHSLIVDSETLPDCLAATATSEANEIMALEHRELPMAGVQFHPEALLTQGGLKLLRNALALRKYDVAPL